MEAPPKFIKNEAGVRMINPAWKAWNDAQAPAANQPPPPPQMPNQATALPVVTSVQDVAARLPGSQPAESVSASVEMLQDADIAKQVGSANPMERVAQVFARYEVPIGLLNKIMGLSDFQIIEMTVDDSGSMNAATDAKLPNGQPMTRWQEVHQRLTQMFEIMALVPCPPVYVRFLNRPDVLDCKHPEGEPPEAYLQRVITMLNAQWQRPPAGGTPARERIAESLQRCPGQSVVRYFFGDGVPNGGADAAQAITQMLIRRPNPAQNPFTFLSCTNEDEAVEWMKECEEAAPFCSEFDDYQDEAREVLKDQGKAFPYTYGMHLVGQLVGAFNPHDLDALDESSPMTKSTLDNMMGYNAAPQEYKHYFDNFLVAQNAQPATSTADKLKKEYIQKWMANFQHFVQAPVAKDIAVVQEYRAKLLDIKNRGL